MGEKEENDQSIHINEASAIHDEVEVSARHYFSHTHIRAAALNARQAAKLEEKHANSGTSAEKTGKYSLEYKSHVCTAVINSALFLETTVHEFIPDINHSYAATEKYDLAPELEHAVRAPDKKTRRQFTREPTLDKYQWLLSFSRKSDLRQDAILTKT